MKLPKIFSPAEVKRSAAYALHMISPGAPVWSHKKTPNWAQESYGYNVIAYSAINRIADAVATIPWKAWKDDKQLDTHPYLDLMARPNPSQTTAEWWRARIIYTLIWGNNYDEGVFSGKKPVELWLLRPDRMSVIPSATGLPSGYIYKVGSKETRFPANPTTGEGPINHTKLFNPIDDWYGMSPISAAAYAIDQHTAGMGWVQSLLQNSARPSGALIVPAESGLSEEEYQRLVNEIEDRYSGHGNAGRPMLLEGGMDWKAMGLSPEDMQILRTKDASARDIALAFGVPPLLLNIPGDNTYANYREARLGFYEDTIIPLLTYQLQELNSWLSPFFGGVTLRPDMAAIEAIAEKREKLWKMANESDDLTLNESRQLKGFPPLPAPLGTTLMVELRQYQSNADAERQTPKKPADEGAEAYGNDV